VIAAQVRREAFVMAYSDAFWIVGVGLIVSLAAITLLRKPPRVAGPVEAH
jgi:MFS transporter, DHA2 family, multidrug resistance protein